MQSCRLLSSFTCHCDRLFLRSSTRCRHRARYFTSCVRVAVLTTRQRLPVAHTLSPLTLHPCARERVPVPSARLYCSLTDSDVKKRVEGITDLFSEARELLDDARSSAETVYFNEDMQDARRAVEDTLQHYEDLLSMLSADRRRTVVAAIGLKMEELRAHMSAMTEEIDS